MKVQLPLFQMGMGGPLGSGEQGLAWVGLDDLVDILYQAIHDPRLEGPVNAVSPHPVSQRTYAKTFGRVLGRPACAPAPAPAIRAITGEMGTEMLLAGAMVRPRKLESLDFAWRHPELEQAMRWELGRFSPEAPPTAIP
jgi:NAD dependent epimerase/dehydratase family enzyme